MFLYCLKWQYDGGLGLGDGVALYFWLEKNENLSLAQVLEDEWFSKSLYAKRAGIIW